MLKVVSARLPAGKGAKGVRTLVAWGWRALGQRLSSWVWLSLLGGPLGSSVTPQFTRVRVEQVYFAVSQGW